jgi:hypothetical protein
MRGALRALAGCTMVVFGIARLIGCGGDDAAETPPDPFASLDGDLPERNLGPDPDAEDPDSSVVVVDPPSYCNGIVFYASLDGTYGPERSGTPGQGFGAAKLVSGGKFTGGVELYADGGGEAGSTVYYFTPPDGGVAWYPDKVGTVSLWYRGNALTAVGGSPVMWRVVGSIPPAPVIGGGLTMFSLPTQFGLVSVDNNQQQQTILTFPRSTIQRYVDLNGFNHFVTGWQRGDAATPTAVMMINGGTGKIYGDAGADAPSYADAQPNEAGDLLVPYRASRARGWDVDASPLAFRLGGTGTSASEGVIDDVVVWNRLLSFSEMEALYAAPGPVGQRCNIK